MSLARKSLASLVCPWTPFLAPRLLRCSQPFAAPKIRPSTHIRGYAAPGKVEWRYQKSANVKSKKENAQNALIGPFTRACEINNVPEIARLYPQAVKSPWWTRDDTRRMVQAIHTYLRSPKTPHKELPATLPLVERIVSDIQSGNLAPHPYAHRDLLSIYKERQEYELGVDFWQWLVYQDNTFVDPSVYGAAIELLAYKGNVTLQSLEDLFSQALKRFPGTFAEYHLSPDAVLPDRSQPFSVVGVPITLLQGILTARVLARDWKNAYLALDTALRIHPSTLPPRFFDLFIQERPISEGYTVFLMACRSGVTPKSRYLTTVLTQLEKCMMRGSLEDRVIIVRAMTNAIFAYLQAGGTLEGPHISVLLSKGYANILPQVQVGQEYSEEENEIRSAIISAAHETASKLVQAGFPAKDYLFAALISIAGHFNVPELFAVVLNDVETSGTDLGPVGQRVALTTAGKLHDHAGIQHLWAKMASNALDRGEILARLDWLALARACRRADMSHFLLAQIDWMKHAITTEVEKDVRAELSRSDRIDSFEFVPMDATKFSEHMDAMQTNMTNVAAAIMAGQPLRDIQKTPFVMYCDPTRKPFGGSIENLRAVYDELTTDPHQPAQRTDLKEMFASPTGIPLDELRFQNWVSIVDLMRDAEEDEQLWENIIARAIGQGQQLRPMAYALNFERHRSMLKGRVDRRISLQTLRDEIRGIRAPNLHTAMVSSQVLPARIKRRREYNTQAQAPIQTYVSQRSSHAAPDYRMYRPLTNNTVHQVPEEPAVQIPTTLSVSGRQNDQITFKPQSTEFDGSDGESPKINEPGLLPRKVWVK